MCNPDGTDYVSGSEKDCAAGCNNADGTCIPVCGNDQVEGTEECDGHDLAGKSCETQDFAGGGVLSCNLNTCKFNTGGCIVAAPVQPLSKQGIKITLTDIGPANDVFSTKITATEDFDNEVTIYTTLYDIDGKVLALKLEKLTGLAKDQTYTATMNYPAGKVKKKSVIVYDVKQNPAVFGSLEALV